MVDDVILKTDLGERSCCESDATAITSGQFRHGEVELVGHGESKVDCGWVVRTYVCLCDHEGTRFDKGGGLVDHSGEAYVKLVRRRCHRPSCPKCYRAWADVEARKIAYRLEEARKVLVKTNKKTAVVEHIVISFPESMHGLSMEVLRRKAEVGLKARGVVGYSIIPHGFRYANGRESFDRSLPFGWRWSPHVHALGFVLGGYGCRGCKKFCSAHVECNGFENRTRRENKKDGLIVKIAVDKFGEASERKSVFFTARYELGHASIRSGGKRVHVVTWGGCVSYRKLKVLPMIKVHAKCPLCDIDLVRGIYRGVLMEGVDVFWAKKIQGGVGVVEVVVEERFYGGGSFDD